MTTHGKLTSLDLVSQDGLPNAPKSKVPVLASFSGAETFAEVNHEEFWKNGEHLTSNLSGVSSKGG